MVTQFVCPCYDAIFDLERQLLEHFCPAAPKPDTEPTTWVCVRRRTASGHDHARFVKAGPSTAQGRARSAPRSARAAHRHCHLELSVMAA
jgi:hypothetical protein